MNKEARQKHSQMQDSSDKPKASKESSNAKDPVCGMNVTTEAGAEHLEHEGHVYYFCSSECREQFEASPDDFDG